MKECGIQARLAELRKHVGEAGASLAEFARLTGIERRLLARYEKDVAPSADNVAKIVKGTRCSAAWLLTGEGQMFQEEGTRPQRVPVVATASGAGAARVAFTDHGREERRMTLPSDAHLVQVTGDSMVPIAVSGQFVWVSNESPVNGDLALIELPDDEVLFKRVYLAGNMLQCISINQDPRYAPMMIHRKDVRRVRKVLGTWYG